MKRSKELTEAAEAAFRAADVDPNSPPLPERGDGVDPLGILLKGLDPTPVVEVDTVPSPAAAPHSALAAALVAAAIAVHAPSGQGQGLGQE